MAIQLTCSCGQRLKANEPLAGKTVKCPKCGGRLQVPFPHTEPVAETPASGDRGLQREEVHHAERDVYGGAGEPVAPRLADLFDEEGIGAPSTSLRGSPGPTRLCPGCQRAVPVQAILCVDCGYHFEQGRKIAVQLAPQPQRDNPFVAPHVRTFEKTEPRRRSVASSGHRSGPEWEGNGDLFARFTGTLLSLVAAPGPTFATMSLRGMGYPITFNIMAYVLASSISLLLMIAYMLIFKEIPGVGQVPQLRGNEAALGLGMICGGAVGIACAAALFALIFPILLLLGAAILHISLLLVGAANNGFEATFRLTGYLSGAMLLSGIAANVSPPAVNAVLSLLLMVAYTVYSCIGAKHIHDTSYPRAVAGNLVSSVICTALIVGLVLAVMALIASLALLEPAVRAG